MVPERWTATAVFTKQEIEIEESDTVVAYLLRAHGIGFGAIEFQSF